MSPIEFRVESTDPISGLRVSGSGFQQISSGDRAVAAAKGATQPSGLEIRVIHVPTGKVVFTKSVSTRPEFSDES